MKGSASLCVLCITGLTLAACGPRPPEDTPASTDDSSPASTTAGSPRMDLHGPWLRRGAAGWVRLAFRDDGVATADLDGDGKADVTSRYVLAHDTLHFHDDTGKTCPEAGIYRVTPGDFYLVLDLVEDGCPGRIQSTWGLWVGEDHDARLAELTARIGGSPVPADYLDRARMYLALGEPAQARVDIERYLALDSSNARAWAHRASTDWPDDLEGVIEDSGRAIRLDPGLVAAYFMRGQAFHALGRHEAGCRDYRTAIGLGFTALREAEAEVCAAYWGALSSRAPSPARPSPGSDPRAAGTRPGTPPGPLRERRRPGRPRRPG